VGTELVQVAEGAGRVLLPFYGQLGAGDASRKGDRRRDLVSEADLAAEEYILAQIPSDAAVIAEESGERSGSGERWVVDPLDGTINFLHGLPFWCVSIAIMDEAGLRDAVVHAPALGWTFAAARGEGCTMNGAPVSVSQVTEIGDAILATGFPYARDTVADNNLDNVPRVGIAAGGLRRMGSAALDLALTAAGRLDGYWELHLSPWDVAAGTLLVREAGGTVTDFHGRPESERVLFGAHIVASNGALHDQIRERLAPLRELD
jgi:myo-inositol-1(or 4)-monophosphatase